jgi:hypothetical protein
VQHYTYQFWRQESKLHLPYFATKLFIFSSVDGGEDGSRHWLPGTGVRKARQCCICFCFLSSRLRLKCDGKRAETNFVFRRNGRVHLSRRGRQFSRLLAVEVCGSAVIMLDTPCSEVLWRVLATHSIRQFPLHSPPVRHRVPSRFNCTLSDPVR